MHYLVTKITLHRRHEGRADESYSFRLQDTTKSIENYRENLKKHFQANSVELNFTEISK
jgi:uncharacterized membrane-anchored protein YhcB (DUF1043 family)